MIARVRALLARPTVCRCGHEQDSHQHWRAGSDCSACDCRRYRRAWHRHRTEPVDPYAVCRDQQLVEAVLADDIGHALLLAEPRFVAALVALHDTGRAAA